MSSLCADKSHIWSWVVNFSELPIGLNLNDAGFLVSTKSLLMCMYSQHSSFPIQHLSREKFGLFSASTRLSTYRGTCISYFRIRDCFLSKKCHLTTYLLPADHFHHADPLYMHLPGSLYGHQLGEVRPALVTPLTREGRGSSS